jgi:hypothetical protein
MKGELEWIGTNQLSSFHIPPLHSPGRDEDSHSSGKDLKYPQIHRTKCHSVSVCLCDAFQVSSILKQGYNCAIKI